MFVSSNLKTIIMKGLYLYFFLCMCIIYSSCNTNHEKEIDGQIVEHIGDYTIRYNEKKESSK